MILTALSLLFAFVCVCMVIEGEEEGISITVQKKERDVFCFYFEEDLGDRVTWLISWLCVCVVFQ